MTDLAEMRSEARRRTGPAEYVKLVGVTNGSQALWAYEKAAQWIRQHDPRSGQYAAAVHHNWRLTMRRSQTGVTAKLEVMPND